MSIPFVALAVFALQLAAFPQSYSCSNPDPAWIACEDFEQGGLGWEGWFAQSPFVECLGCSAGQNLSGRIQLLNDPAQAHHGTWSLYMPAASTANYEGASLSFRSCAGTKRAGCSLTGFDQLFFSVWVKLASDHQMVHHFLSLGGTKPDGYWDSEGNAGCRPNSTRAAGTTLDFNPSSTIIFKNGDSVQI